MTQLTGQQIKAMQTVHDSKIYVHALGTSWKVSRTENYQILDNTLFNVSVIDAGWPMATPAAFIYENKGVEL